jgi:BolA family transcriptional regulator, general stress-responsive regulator
MDRSARIERLLSDSLSPSHLEIVDESHLHAGHAGARDGGETHYRVTVVAAVFEADNRVGRQRRVNALLAEEFGGGLHALSIRALTPKEYSDTQTT